EMKKPDPCVVTSRGGWRPPGVSGVSGGVPNSRKKRSMGEPLCSSKFSERFVFTPMTAGFTASTTLAKLVGPEALRPKSSAADCGDAECTGARQSSGTRLAEAPAAAASAMLQTSTAGRPDGLFVAVGFWSSMCPRCRANVSFALVGDLKKKSPHKARRVPLDLPGAPEGQCRVHVNAAPSGRFRPCRPTPCGQPRASRGPHMVRPSHRP